MDWIIQVVRRKKVLPTVGDLAVLSYNDLQIDAHIEVVDALKIG